MPPSLEAEGQYLLLRFAGPGGPVRNVGVLLYDPRAERLYWRVRTDWQDIADPDDVELLAEVSLDLPEQAARVGAGQFLRGLEDTLSHALRLSERRIIQVTDFQEAADALYELHVVRAAACEEGLR